MGYCASGTGYIEFKEELSEEKYNEVRDILCGTFDIDGTRSVQRPDSEDPYTCFDIWGSERYYGDAVEETLNDVAAAAEIKEGEIQYHGEDDCVWRFVFRDGGWHEENGEANYTGIDADKLFSALRDYVLHDLEAADPSYVRETLTDVCGLTDAEIGTLDLGI